MRHEVARFKRRHGSGNGYTWSQLGCDHYAQCDFSHRTHAIVFDRALILPLLAFCAGATSGFSGSAGPLKGIALRNMEFDRRHMVGAASAVSLAGDTMKATIFTQNALLDSASWLILLGALPLMPLATLIGRRFVAQMSERTYTVLFWLVMAGYLLRLLLA
ncbi:MAG: TSUP family transporter [Pyrinomonadaceae bacterium]